MGFAEYVATVLDNLVETSASIDRRGKRNWEHLGSKESCWRCGTALNKLEPGSVVKHHILPKSEGGSESSDNKSILCSNCHSVVHTYYLPTGKIGRKRTRDGASRLVGKFKDGTTISQLLPSPDHALGNCHKCGIQGKIVGVTEGYWNGEGLIVFLDCTNAKCGQKFGEPFIGTGEAPTIDPVSEILLAIDVGLNLAPDTLPADLKARVNSFTSRLKGALRDLRREVNYTSLEAQRSPGKSQEDRMAMIDATRQKHAAVLRGLLPDAQLLEQECKLRRTRR